MQPKRDTFSQCQKCGTTFRQSGIGRMRKFCSDACKMSSHRNPTRQPRENRRSTIKFDIATLERVAGFFAAQGKHHGQEAIEHLARQLFVELDANEIDAHRRRYQASMAHPEGSRFGPGPGAGQNVTVGESATVTK